MIGIVFIELLFLFNIAIIAMERKSRCWKERKFWISVFFMVSLLALSVYGYSFPTEGFVH